MIDSEVATYDPPRTLAYSWSHGGQPLRPLCWQLEDLGAATRLTLTIGTPAATQAAFAIPPNPAPIPLADEPQAMTINPPAPPS